MVSRAVTNTCNAEQCLCMQQKYLLQLGDSSCASCHESCLVVGYGTASRTAAGIKQSWCQYFIYQLVEWGSQCEEERGLLKPIFFINTKAAGESSLNSTSHTFLYITTLSLHLF